MFAYLAVFERQCIIYRPELHNLQATRKKLKQKLLVETENSINVKTEKIFKYDYFESLLTCPKYV